MNAVTPDPSSCPLCGQSNQCAMEAGLGIEACWCTATPIEPTALQAIPQASQGRACLCPACATRAHPPQGGGLAKANPSGH
ncbi:Cysteine-rich CWC [Acidovorax sp. 56]|nr:Cysteine-rich CWC [Acidovorax sp. 56]